MKYWKFLRKYLKTSQISTIFSFLCCLIFVPCTLLVPYFSGVIIDLFIDMIADEANAAVYINEITTQAILMCASIVLATIFWYIYEAFVNIFIEKITRNLRNDLFNKISNLPFKEFDKYREGDLITRLTTDIENISTGLISGYKQLFHGIITICFVLGFMFAMNWLLALIILVLTPLSFFLSYWISKNSHKYFKLQSVKNGKISNITLEAFNNVDVVKSFNLEETFTNEFAKENDELYKVGQKAQFISSLTNPSTRLINNSIYAIVGVVGALLIIFSDSVIASIAITVGGVSTFLQYANQFAKPLNEISSCITDVQTAIASFVRVQEILELEEEKDKILQNSGDLQGFSSKTGEKLSINSLKFEDVSFGYSDKLLFENLNFEVKKGQKVAIVGETGSGKTTIISLILRFYELNGGDILINNETYKNIPVETLRNSLGMVLQDSWIFKGTVFDNIAYVKKDATKDEVIEASKKAHCYNFINRLPEKFDTTISDSEGLSKGEKQLISLARIMLLSPDFVILDEATSNVDARTEKKIGDVFDALMKNKTSIVIAHRLSTIKSSDLILVLKNGKIFERGNHKELLAKKSYYYDIYKAQFE